MRVTNEGQVGRREAPFVTGGGGQRLLLLREHLRGQAGLGVGDPELLRALVGHRQEAADAAGDGVLGDLRLEHKQASLEELGQLHEPALTKDAIAGRIRRLLAMADKKAQDLGIPDTESSLTPEMLAEQQ